nr:hypothetical protein [Nocardioides sp. B-3]
MPSTSESLLSIVPVVPVVVIDDLSHAVPVARALVAGGLPVIELTLRTPVALAAIRAIATEVPEISVGAGTIVSPSRGRAGGRGRGAVPGVTGVYADAPLGHVRLRAPLPPGNGDRLRGAGRARGGLHRDEVLPGGGVGRRCLPEVDRVAPPGCALLPDGRDHVGHGRVLPRAAQRRVRRRVVADALGRPRER